MKICFIVSGVLNLDGVERVVSVLANKLSEENDVTILCTQKAKANRETYNLNSKIK